MKKALKILGYALGAVILLVGGFAGYIYFKGVPKYAVVIPSEMAAMKVPMDSAHVERGQKIASMLCRECHLDSKTGRLSGAFRPEIPAEFGKIYSLNITQDKEKGIGAWSDGQIYYFLRTGIRPTTGQYVPPYMPKFPLLADEDLKSIIAWLRSPDPVCQPDSHEFPANQANFLVKFLSNVAFGPLPLPAAPILVPDSTNQIALGKYIANAMSNCYACHSADFKKMNDFEPEKSAGFYGGGNPMLAMDGLTIVPSANITMDKETGIGAWSEADFLAAVKEMKNPRGGVLHYPMIPHSRLTDTEVRAIFAYLKTIPTIKNEVKRYYDR